MTVDGEIRSEYRLPLSASPDTIWHSVTSIDGINFELMPYLSLENTGGVKSIAEISASDNEARIVVVPRLGGRIAMGRVTIRLLEVDTHRFVEQSNQPGMDFWNHERSLVPQYGAALLIDRVRFRPLRFPGATRFVVDRLFRHRHARLDRRWNGTGGL